MQCAHVCTMHAIANGRSGFTDIWLDQFKSVILRILLAPDANLEVELQLQACDNTYICIYIHTYNNFNNIQIHTATYVRIYVGVKL